MGAQVTVPGPFPLCAAKQLCGLKLKTEPRPWKPEGPKPSGQTPRRQSARQTVFLSPAFYLPIFPQGAARTGCTQPFRAFPRVANPPWPRAKSGRRPQSPGPGRPPSTWESSPHSGTQWSGLPGACHASPRAPGPRYSSYQKGPQYLP